MLSLGTVCALQSDFDTENSAEAGEAENMLGVWGI